MDSKHVTPYLHTISFDMITCMTSQYLRHAHLKFVMIIEFYAKINCLRYLVIWFMNIFIRAVPWLYDDIIIEVE